MKEMNRILGNGITEAYVKLPDNCDVSKEMRSIKSYVFHFGVTAAIDTIYCCDSKGKGLRLLRVTLDKPIERKSTWGKINMCECLTKLEQAELTLRKVLKDNPNEENVKEYFNE